MKSLILTFATAAFVLIYGTRLLSAGSVYQDAEIVLDEDGCMLLGGQHAPLIDRGACKVTADLRYAILNGDMILEFRNGDVIQIERDRARVIAFAPRQIVYKSWNWLTTTAGYLLILAWLGGMFWWICRDLTRLTNRPRQGN